MGLASSSDQCLRWLNNGAARGRNARHNNQAETTTAINKNMLFSLPCPGLPGLDFLDLGRGHVRPRHAFGEVQRIIGLTLKALAEDMPGGVLEIGRAHV